MALDSTATNLYISENQGNRIRQVVLSTGVINTYVGTGVAGPLGDGGLATGAQLNAPLGISVDASGYLYISDRGNQRIRMVTPGGSPTITTIVGTGTAGFSGDGGAPTSAEIQNAIQAVVGPGPNSTLALYISDWDNHRIRQTIATPTGNTTASATSLYPSNIVAGSSAFTLTVRGTNFVPGATVQFGTGNSKATTFVSSKILTASILPGDVNAATTVGVTVTNPGVSASSPQTFTVLASVPTSPDTTIITFAGNGINSFDGDGGPALYASFSTIVQSAFDSSGNMYIADCGNNRVRMINPAGTITTIAGGGNSTQESIPATAAQLYCPHGVAVDSVNNILYIGEYNGYRVRKMLLSTNTLTTYAGPTPAAGNNPGFGGDGGPAAQASFGHISSLVLDTAAISTL